MIGRHFERAAVLGVVAAMVASACGTTATASPSAGSVAGTSPGGTQTLTPSGIANAVDPAIWTAPGEYLDLQVITDEPRMVRQVVDASGAVLTASGADGTRYSLTIPPQALWVSTIISMTPLAAISGRGANASAGDLFAVQLEPSGLELFPEATLRIEPATSLDDQMLVYFGYQGDGEDAGMVVPDPREGGHVLALDHFSGAGIVRREGPPTGGESDMVEVLVDQMVARLGEDRLARLVAHDLAKDRMAVLAGMDPDLIALSTDMTAWYTSYFEQVIQPRLRIAANPAATCDEAGAVIASLLDVQRQRAILGAGDDEGAMSAILDAYARAAELAGPLVEAACRRDAARECRETGDLTAVIHKGILEMRSKSLLGGSSDAELGAVQEAYEAILRWCGVYELRWTSNTRIVTENYTVSSVIEGHLTLRYIEGNSDPTVPPQLEGHTESALLPMLQKVTCSAAPATMTCAPGAPPTSPTHALIAEFVLRRVSTEQVGGQQIIRTIGENRLELRFRPSAMVLQALIKANGVTVSVPIEIYQAAYLVAHEPDKVDDLNVAITEWMRGGHPLMFSKTYTGSRVKEKVTYSDTTVFEFIHTPDPEPT